MAELERGWPAAISSMLVIKKDCCEPNWDSYGAEPIGHAELGDAIVQLGRLCQLGWPPPHNIVPTVRGHFQFEWDFGMTGIECELGDGPPKWLIASPSSDVEFGGNDE